MKAYFAIVIRYFIYFKITPVFFEWMFFNSIKETNRLRKEINRLLSKGVSNITRSQNFDFLGFENLSPGQFWGAPAHADIIELLVAT